MALLFLCVALLIHAGQSSPLDDLDDIRESVSPVKRAAEEKKAEEPSAKISVGENPYDRPSNWHLDMYRLLTIALFLGFAVIMYFVVWRFCSGPPA